MGEFLSIFIAGFEDTVLRHIPRELGGAEMIHISGGFAHYKYAGKPEFVARLPFINNSFAVLTKYQGAGNKFDKLVRDSAKKTFRHIGEYKSFRVRFSNENQFEKVPKSLMELAESVIIKNCGMYADRMKPKCEFWFIIRRDGRGYLGQLLNKRGGAGPGSGAGTRAGPGSGPGANLSGGELRPELACLLCLDLEFGKSAVVCDPFAGYGAIPIHIQKYCEYDKIYVSDIDARLVARLKRGALGRGAGVVISCADAARLNHIDDASVDLIVTDPPWGFVGEYSDIVDLYRRAFAEMRRIIKAGGKIALLTGRPAETTDAARRNALSVLSRVNVLVNGKKASVFTLGKKAT